MLTGDTLALTDHHALACTLWGETRGESIEGKIAVANVIRNRLKSGRWGDTYRDVCLWPWQFSCWKPQGGKENYEQTRRMAYRLTQDEKPDDNVLRECLWIAHGMVGEWIQDSVKGATHYHTADMNPRPYWANGKTPVCAIGKHLFYKGIK
jgi:N-acetylmuramoyl-L-alanine amidase